MTVGFKFCPSGKIIARFDGLTDLSYNKISLTVIRGTLVQFWKILQNLATFPACVPTRRFPEIIPAHNRKIAFSKKVDEFSRNRPDLLPEKTKFQKKYLDVSRNRQYGPIGPNVVGLRSLLEFYQCALGQHHVINFVWITLNYAICILTIHFARI